MKFCFIRSMKPKSPASTELFSEYPFSAGFRIQGSRLPSFSRKRESSQPLKRDTRSGYGELNGFLA